MPGKLIVIEGIDGSGKSTQLSLLKSRLQKENIEFVYQRFPRYDNPSSQLVRMYLGGEFGSDPDSVSPYAASAFYAVDRAAAFAGPLGEEYRNGKLLLMDRYTTANLVHQAAKLSGEAVTEFADWLDDFEYNRLALPRPDLVLLLDMPARRSMELIGGRDGARDIHEKDIGYLSRCAETALAMAARFGWQRISCVEGDLLRTPADISDEIYSKITTTLLGE